MKLRTLILRRLDRYRSELSQVEGMLSALSLPKRELQPLLDTQASLHLTIAAYERDLLILNGGN